MRKVVQTPLKELWRLTGPVAATRTRMLNRSGIAELLRTSVVQFVVADVGKLPQWIDVDDRFNFWKGEAKPHVAEADSRIELDRFPDGYCYIASQWDGEELGHPVVLLERHH